MRRTHSCLNVSQYGVANLPTCLGRLTLAPPDREQNVLRMLIKRTHSPLLVPDDLAWTRPLIERALEFQVVRHPFMYLTVRNGEVQSVSDDEWHVDGFSMVFEHLPEQNYIWSDSNSTEYYTRAIPLPDDFDPFEHNIHQYFQARISPSFVAKTAPGHVYMLDPYVIHRRPPETAGTRRCFVRLSFTPIEIEDVNNTLNPLLATNYTRDGVAEFRNSLKSYDELQSQIRFYERVVRSGDVAALTRDERSVLEMLRDNYVFHRLDRSSAKSLSSLLERMREA